ncbi:MULTISPECIES: MarR family winged helix-turn-helix transcriptional regulator [unclassified Deinococcus]|jgi:DNA-binding MarR family transcriptional regulator|uniref:MarR family winged helix-turn-helix transcriptional regulator n=1 Tax=unclassified Deinococcus TaxID=2623546 RepID=UPI001C3048EC|nr:MULTISPECIES: MarR family transcriptional regulator [unclassified Deinococcus]MDK2011993.1 MarR family transcriptional regulator [Deinococcus sp. 43]
MSSRAFLTRVEEDWQVRRPDLDVSPMLHVLRLTRLGELMQARLDRLLATHGLNAAGWDLLLTLYRSAPPEGLRPGELLERCAVNGPATSNRIARLSAQGLITREVRAPDRRQAYVRLNPAGTQLVEVLLPEFLALETSLLNGLSAAGLTNLGRLSETLVHHLERHDTP